MPFSKATSPFVVPRILSIAGTDPTGGAGLQADLKSIVAAGGYGMGVVTTLVSQNTLGVRAIHTPPAEFLTEQLAAVSDDVTIDAVKIGMLGTRELTEAVTAWVREVTPPIVVLDPVMVATSGDRLLDEDALSALRDLVAVSTVITPNVPELALLADKPEARDISELMEQALEYAHDNDIIVIAKTGHLEGDEAGNAVAFPDGNSSYAASPRIDTKNTHGTGCSLSSALATRLGAGDEVADALKWTTRWLYESIRFADELHVGHGRGPIDHSHRSRRLEAMALRRMYPVQMNSYAPQAMLDAAAENTEEIKSFFGQRLKIRPAGPHTQALWAEIQDIVEEIGNLVCFNSLVAGNLSSNDTKFFLAQEAWYLAKAFPAISLLATKAPNAQEQAMWSSVAQESLVRALELNESALGKPSDTITDIEPTTITQLLLDMHSACAAFKPYSVAIATITAELWMTAELALKASMLSEDGSTISEWMKLNSDPTFVENAQQCVNVLEKAMAEVSDKEKLMTRDAFRRAAVLNREAYAQPGRGW
ncbi:MAG: bifunctional hydroxymethylpyrimidine kinase/phosphomethylpyrimidine kinase [Corynebacterium sp.]|uniref:bifunctional hydroxymethylpyrimidine kinase/phosphomethylpyrimidine kinase n=1 Tax=Corynebacterium sp. TaxID=1720 RepID=UPI0026DCA5E3|nr:bifunctional hydroxymethylpyrimidine kinase/phosphomethylpyrimidine kinase [Corynebacterium sp.]MDO5029006.1 bifunctional hydroxymethylpyrimidine kinase/phosphomethylpyrimidine kinase [Corynebacterium sp.]